MKTKLYLCGITSSDNTENLKEMIEPIRPYFDGLCFTFHLPKDDGADFLESQKGCGKIIYADWCQRHAYSQNHFLYQGPMQDGEYFILLDSMERLSFNFCAVLLPTFIEAMETHNIAMVANYGKGLIFRYNEQLEFRGSPHWYAQNLDGQSTNIELAQTDFWNVRNRNRDKFQFVDHYMKYMLYPAGSNHSLLGLDHHPEGNNFFPVREKRRLLFRHHLRDIGCPLTVDGVKDLFSKPLDQEIKDYINFDLVANDFYRYHILKDETLIDNHHWKEMVKID